MYIYRKLPSVCVCVSVHRSDYIYAEMILVSAVHALFIRCLYHLCKYDPDYTYASIRKPLHISGLGV